jgi:hypothetical protein
LRGKETKRGQNSDEGQRTQPLRRTRSYVHCFDTITLAAGRLSGRPTEEQIPRARRKALGMTKSRYPLSTITRDCKLYA